jgi:P-type Ca2+ transporter type 2C
MDLCDILVQSIRNASSRTSSLFARIKDFSIVRPPKVLGRNTMTDRSEVARLEPEEVVEYIRRHAAQVFDDKNAGPPGALSASSNTFHSILQSTGQQLREPLILMLLSSAVLSLLLGNTADAISIFFALFIVSLVAAIQEVRSERALQKLQTLVPQTAKTVDGRRIHSHELQWADIVLLETGDRIPADVRLIHSVSLGTDESAMTGESCVVNKTASAILPAATAEDQHNDDSCFGTAANICLAGTLVVTGHGRGVVIGTRESTELGQIAAALEQTEARKSPLQIQLDLLSQVLARNCTVAIGIISVVGWIMKRPVLETLQVGVSLAVAAIPEGLPICVTVTLALGVLKMAKSNVIVKKLAVVESLGCATAVCSDKVSGGGGCCYWTLLPTLFVAHVPFSRFVVRRER